MAKKTYSVKVLKPQTNSLAEMWNAYKKDNPTSWTYAFGISSWDHRKILNYLTFDDLNVLDFSGSENVEDMDNMFGGDKLLTSVPLFDTSNVMYISNMFYQCTALTSVPAFDLSKVVSMRYTFSGCKNLTSIPAFNLSNVTSFDTAFWGCQSLTEFHATGMKVSFSLSFSTKMSETALVEVLNNLATVTSTQTLTLGSTNLNKLTAEEKAIATQKGWTLS